MLILVSRKRSLFALVLAAIAAAAPGAGAQGADAQAANVTDDIRFARDLARYRYFDLAVDWLASVEQGGRIAAENKAEVALAKATISRLASEYALSRDDRKRFYDEAITQYRTAIQSLGSGMTPRKAEELVDGLSSVLLSKGKFYIEEIDLLTGAGAGEEAVKKARASADEAFREAVKNLNDAYEEIRGALDEGVEGATAEQMQRLRDLGNFALYRRGEAYYSWALLYPPQDFSREDYLGKAAAALEDYVWEAGDESIWGLYAYYYLGLSEWQRGKIEPTNAVGRDEKAIASLSHVYSDFGVDLSRLPQLEDNERAFVQELVERAYLGVAEVYENAARRIDASPPAAEEQDLTPVARAYQLELPAPVQRAALVAGLRQRASAVVDEMVKQMRTVGLKLGPFAGRAQLVKARALAESGSPAPALDVVNEVVKANEGNVVGLEARSLLAELLGQTDASAVPANVLMQAARGHLAEGRHLDAIHTFHRAIAASTSDADRKAFLPEAWLAIAQSYQQLGRNLEAALAYEEGFAAMQALRDEENVGELALGAYNAWDRRFKETGHEFDRKERDRMRDVVTGLGISGDVQYLVAKEAFTNASAIKEAAERKAAFAKAVAEFDKVAQDSVYYERGLVYKARAQAEAGEPDAALATFESLLARAKDARFAVGLDKRKSSQRSAALAEAVYYRGQVLFDLGRFDDVVTTLADYKATFDDKTAFFPFVDLLRVRALAKLGRMDEAEKLLAELEQASPENAATGYAMQAVAGGFLDAYVALSDEEKAAERGRTFRRKAADYLARFNERSGYDSLANIKNVADWYRELADSERDPSRRESLLALAEENYRRIFERFGKNPGAQKTLERDVKEPYAKVLLAQHRYKEALPLWRDVYAANRRSREVLRNYAKALGGWVELQDGKVKAYPGAGEYEEALKIWGDLRKGIEDAGDKLSDAWWETNANSVYAIHMLAQKQPTMKAQGRHVVKNWRTLYPDLGGDHWKRIIDSLDAELAR